MCVSFACVDSGLSEDALAKREAILNCCNKEWWFFHCILGLSSVVNRNIFTYPDSGDYRYRLFDHQVKPSASLETGLYGDDLHILILF